MGGQQAAGGGDAVEDGHTQIHQDDVGAQRVGRGQRLQPIARFAYNLQVFV